MAEKSHQRMLEVAVIALKPTLDDRTVLAVEAAAQLASDQKHNSSDLIPEVTQLVKTFMTAMLENYDKGIFCKKFGDELVQRGIMQRSQ